VAKPVTAPPEWRRRADLAAAWVAGNFATLSQAAKIGLDELDAGLDADAAAVFCRRIVWGQPEDLPGILLVPEGSPIVGADAVAAAHAPDQPFTDLGLGVLFLARRFAERGDEEDLAAAAELHDLAVALGEHLWDGPHCAVLGRAAAELFALTGDEAFLATAERAADTLCEVQGPDGAVGDVGQSARIAQFLREMADAVETRLAADLDPEPEAETRID
jgi:hypothetical protein